MEAKFLDKAGLFFHSRSIEAPAPPTYDLRDKGRKYRPGGSISIGKDRHFNLLRIDERGTAIYGECDPVS
jgi:hypothetical protein